MSTTPLPAQNPILAELSNLSPGAKTALLNAHAASSTPLATQASPQSSTLLAPQTQPTLPKLQAPSANSSPAQIGASAPQRTLSTQSAPAAPPMQAPKIAPQNAEPAPKLLSTPMAKPAMPNLEAPARPAIHIGPPVVGAPSTIGPAPDPSVLAGVSMSNSGSTHPNLEPPQSSTIITGPKRGEEMYSNGESIRRGTLLGDKIELERAKENGPGEEQLYHKITGSHFGQEHPFLAKVLGGAAAGLTGAADIGLTTVGGGFGRLAAEMTPGTILNHELDLNRKNNAVKQDEANAKDEASTANLDAQPQLRMLAAQLAQDKLNEKQQHDQGALTEKTEHDRQMIDQHLRTLGYKLGPDNKPVALDYSEMSPLQQANQDYKTSQAAYEKAAADFKQAQKNNLPEQMELARQRALTAMENARTAAERLGISREALNFHEDEFYKPQPTPQERGRGDLAQSAVDRIGEMREILQRRSDIFGPRAGRETRIKAWLGSQDPDAQTYLSANRYLADHSTGVFGGRANLTMRSLESLTDPTSNPAAEAAALDEAERTARGFVNAGTPHGRGGHSSFNGTQQGYAHVAVGAGGHQVGSNDGKTWYDVQTGKQVQ